MDGLSAASSVLAVVSLAIELPSAIQNLVKFCKTIEDAPEDVRRLMEELDCFAVALSNADPLGRSGKSDQVVAWAVYRCNEELMRLRQMLEKFSKDLTSSNSRKQKLGAIRMAFKKPIVEAMRSSLENVKSTLILVKSISFQSSTELNFQRQNEMLLDIMQVLHGPPPTYGIEPSAPRARDVSREISADEQIIQSENNVRANSVFSSDPRQNAIASIDSNIRGWNSVARTPFGQLQAGYSESFSRIRTNLEPSQRYRSWRLYPSALLRFVGVKYGALIQSSVDGWKWTMTPFNAVASDAPIFQFCRKGDLEAVKALLTLGHASLWDRDPEGRTPLWIATQCSQLEIAEFLLREGADIHACDWATKKPRPAIIAVQATSNPDAASKFAMMSLFEKYHPGGYDLDVMWYLLIRLVMFHRPDKYPEERYQESRDATLTVIQPVIQRYFSHDDDIYSLTSILLLDFRIKGTPLQWTLRNVRGLIPYEKWDWWNKTCAGAIHRAITERLLFTDPLSMKIIVEKSEDLHSRWDPDFIVSGTCNQFTQIFTPTVLAMYHPATFTAWRTILREFGNNFDDFVKQELIVSPLVEDGWTFDSLAFLFKTPISAEPEINLENGDPCDRCSYRMYNPHIHLPWRKYLRAVRNGHRGPFTEAMAFQFPQNKYICEDAKFRLVCSRACRDSFYAGGIFENNLADTDITFGPEIPVLVSENAKCSSTAANQTTASICPSKAMPGAFID